MNGILQKVKRGIPGSLRKKIDKGIDSMYGVTFSGWGMKTTCDLPWNGPDSQRFLDSHTYIKKHFDFSGDDGVSAQLMDKLLWRHWVVSYCARHAVIFAGDNADIAECGVCDGITAFFALNELEGKAKMHLYDAWAPMREDHLVNGDTNKEGDYSNISLLRTKKNLEMFDKKTVYHAGYIPESLYVKPAAPKKISYLHIDLNAAKPTIAALEYFFPRIVGGGVILFDDYGHLGYSKTKETVDVFFAGKGGILMPLPTGQAIYYVRKGKV